MGRAVNRMRAVHPGEVLREEYLVPLNLSVNALAMALGVPATRIHEIVKERRGVTADTAERLARYFGGDAASWLALQADYELKTLATRDDIARKVSPREAAPAQVATVAAERSRLPAPVGLTARTQDRRSG
jgi:addiction module HigA family antidote